MLLGQLPNVHSVCDWSDKLSCP